MPMIFIYDSFWFWGLVAAELLVLFICAANEKGLWATLSILVSLAAVQFLGNVDVFGYVYHNPISILVGLLVYVLGGVIWVFPKWYFFVKDHFRKYIDLKEEFLESKKIKTQEVPEEMKREWQEYFRRGRNMRYDADIEFKPSPKKHKEQIMAWMVCWPFSLLWTMLNDPIVRFFHHVYYYVLDNLQRISDNVFKGVGKDFSE